jgi:hypothetical protein
MMRVARIGLVLALAGCATVPVSERVGVEPATRLLAPVSPPVIEAKGVEDLVQARQIADLATYARIAERPRSRPVEAARLPFLSEAPVAQAFLSGDGPRALARGEPSNICPAIGLAAPGEAASNGAAAELALRRCLSELSDVDGDCGCRVLALGDVLTAPPAEFVYAPGVSARLIRLDDGDEATLVAEERQRSDGPEGVRLWFLAADGPRAVGDLGEDGRAEVTLLQNRDGVLTPVRRYQGRRQIEGYRRGRLAERLYLRDDDGNRMIALIGYEPSEFSERAKDLRAWPAGG